jgi:hypothetical protein
MPRLAPIERLQDDTHPAVADHLNDLIVSQPADVARLRRWIEEIERYFLVPTGFTLGRVVLWLFDAFQDVS